MIQSVIMRYKIIGGYLDLEQEPKLSEVVLAPAVGEPPMRKPPKSERAFPESKELGVEIGGGWRMIMSQEGNKRSLWDFEKVKECLSEGLAEYDGELGVLTWRPRFYKKDGKWSRWDGNPSSSVWKPFPRTALADGVRVKMKYTSSKDVSLPGVDYEEKWNGGEEQANNLRCVAGTGDFRVALIQTNGKKDPGDWHYWQVRINPHLHREAKNHIGKDDASNSSFWYRETPGEKDTLIDDYSQDVASGRKKLKHAGQLKFGMGPHTPYDKEVDVEFCLKTSGGEVASSVRVGKDEVQLDPYEHKTSGFNDEFTHVDAVCWSFNNMRPYCDVKLECDGW